ncbi:MAG: response regulator [Bacteroidetes bacterium]|nr:MAG: response regulator [Bacteroidota bacterium]
MDRKKTILLADDDPDQIFLVKHHLEKWGYDVVAVDSREEAERYLAGASPDLAILDLMMEEEDSGFILSYRIKRKKPDIPVIISTAVASERGISFDLNSPGSKSWIKADHYLEKGFRMEQLKMLVEKLLK